MSVFQIRNSEITRFKLFCKEEHNINTWKRILAEWIQIQSGDDSRKTTRYNTLLCIEYFYIDEMSVWDQIEKRRLWIDDYNHMANSMVCSFAKKSNIPILNSESTLTEGLSHMWKMLSIT